MKTTLLSGLSAMAICLATALTPHAAWAQVSSQEGIALQNQILSLQNQLQQVQGQVQQNSLAAPQPSGGGGGGGGDSGPLTTQLLQRVSSLEDQVRTLNGQVQQLQNQVQTQNAQLTKQMGDLSFQVQNGGGGGGGAAAAAGGAALGAGAAAAAAPAAPSAPSAGPGVAATPETLLQQGNLALRQSQFKDSEGIAREILAKHGKSPRAYDAQFLLAQSLQGQQRYQDAAIAFDDTYNMNHKGKRAPSALLGLAATLGAINQKAAACDTLRTLNAQFPKPPPYLVAPIAGQHKKLGC